MKNTYQLWHIKDLIEATLTKLPFGDNLSEQERTLTKCGATHRTYEKGGKIANTKIGAIPKANLEAMLK